MPTEYSRARASAYFAAIRPKTLGAAVAPVIVGSALAAAEGAARPGVAVAALVGALAIQIGTNLFNDWADYEKGADGADRLGPPRAVASGWLSPRAALGAAAVSFGVAALAGAFLVAAAGWPVAVIGAASAAAGVAYTAGPFPLAYRGLGEVFVVLFFGLVATAGTHFVHTGRFEPLALAAGAPLGLLAAAILAVNNLRDRHGDRRAGKRTLAARFGAAFARREYAFLLAGAYAIPAAAWALGAAGAGWLAPLATAPAAVRLSRAIVREDGRALNARLAQTARLELAFAFLLAAGVLL